MNKKNWEENFQKKWAKEDLKKSKSGSISYIEDIDRLTSYPEQFHAHWETYLTPHDYWENWREKINSFQTEKEVYFYTSRLRAFMEFVEKYTRKDINRYCGRVIEGAQQWDPINTPKMIEQELKRLENISEEEFNRTDEWRKNGPVFKELSTEEILNDPWFNKEIDKFFGLENGKLPKEERKPVEEDNNNDKSSVDIKKKQINNAVDRTQKDKNNLSAVKSLGIIGAVSVLVIAGAVIAKKQLSKKIKKNR